MPAHRPRFARFRGPRDNGRTAGRRRQSHDLCTPAHRTGRDAGGPGPRQGGTATGTLRSHRSPRRGRQGRGGAGNRTGRARRPARTGGRRGRRPQLDGRPPGAVPGPGGPGDPRAQPLRLLVGRHGTRRARGVPRPVRHLPVAYEQRSLRGVAGLPARSGPRLRTDGAGRVLHLVAAGGARGQTGPGERRLGVGAPGRGRPQRPQAGPRPGWVLAGDAGHHKDPVSAQGISDAFADSRRAHAAPSTPGSPAPSGSTRHWRATPRPATRSGSRPSPTRASRPSCAPSAPTSSTTWRGAQPTSRPRRRS